MSEAIERLINLAFFLADARDPVSARDVRERVAGYPEGQDEDAFLRMFERDKKELRASGLVIDTIERSFGNAYRLDRAATFQAPVDLSREDVAVLRAVGAAFVRDPSFPFGASLATALAKLSAPPVRASGPAPVDADAEQGARAATLARACVARKRVRFDYRNAAGVASSREIEPGGLFLRDGSWYVVGRDVEKDDARVFAVRRMQEIRVHEVRPGTPDFEWPEDFDATEYARLPFEFGPEPFEAVLEFEADFAWRAAALTEGRGVLVSRPNGSLRWTVQAADAHRLARWVVENGPGIALVAPPEAVEALCSGLERAKAAHG